MLNRDNLKIGDLIKAISTKEEFMIINILPHSKNDFRFVLSGDKDDIRLNHLNPWYIANDEWDLVQPPPVVKKIEICNTVNALNRGEGYHYSMNCDTFGLFNRTPEELAREALEIVLDGDRHGERAKHPTNIRVRQLLERLAQATLQRE